MLQNITNNSYFIENYSRKTITISSTQNNNGVIEVDDIGNSLSSAYFTLGEVEVGRLTKYDYADSLLVYDSIGYDLYNKSDNIDMMIEWKSGTRYKIGGRIEKSISYDSVSSTFLFRELFVNSDTIFKAFVNNYEVPRTDLLVTNGNIKIVGNSTNRLNNFIDGDDMVIVVYKTDQTITTDITIEYESVDSIIDIDNMSDYTYFDNTFSKKYNNIKSTSDSAESATTRVERRRQYKDREIRTTITNRITLEMYEDTKYDSLSLLEITDRFRIICVGTLPQEIIIWNNCRRTANFTTRFDKEFNTMSFNVTYDNKQRILLNDNEKTFKFFNDGVYNSDIYG